LGSRFGLLAFHGGNLEKGTDVIAAAAASASGASLYTIVQPPDLRWHLPSVEFQPSRSEALASFLSHVTECVAVHGYGREGRWTTLLLGGRNRSLAAALGAALRTGLPDFEIVDSLDDIPVELRGVHPRNPVNLPSGGGVQLELPPRVRSGTGVPSYQPAYEAAVVDALVAVAQRSSG
jgi:phage replication-related protein YjqB (UPF0714/DUF867 family)